MLIRALIVVLAVLNLGVALWWMNGSESPPPPVAAGETGVATLEILPSPASAPAPIAAPVRTAALPASAPVPSSAEKSAAAVAPVAAPDKPVVPPVEKPPLVPAPAVAAKPEAKVETRPEQCVSLGPFADRASADAAMARVAAEVARPRVREVAGNQANSYRVWIPPAASREDAQAMTKRIVAAGFGDYYVISQGEEANAVALGQYRNREGAERRMAALKAAGFPVALVPSGSESAASWWIDAAVAASSSAGAVGSRSGAAKQQSLDCARLR